MARRTESRHRPGKVARWSGHAAPPDRSVSPDPQRHSGAEPRGSAGWPSIRLPGQKEGEVGGKLSAGRSPLRSLEPHCGSPASPRPSRRRVSLLATVPIRGTSFDAARVALMPNPAQGESGGLLTSQLQLRVPTPFTPSLVSEWITDVSADLTNTAQKTAQPFRRSRAPTLLRLCARSACLLISPAHPEDL